MLTMTDINSFRNNHDKSMNDIAQTLNFDFRTAKKHADPLSLRSQFNRKNGMMYDKECGALCLFVWAMISL